MEISLESSGSRLRHWVAMVVVAAAILTAGCGTLPAAVDRPASIAIKATGASPLGRVAQASQPAAELTGFRLMPLGSYSLDSRVALAERATQSLDVQYYLIANDKTGRLLLRSLRDASKRGVRVRLIVDDLYTTGGDPLFVGLAAFPNVE